MNEKRSVDKRLWLIVSMAACTIVIMYTARPIYQNPQLEPDDYRYLEQVQHLKQDFWKNFSKVYIIEIDGTRCGGSMYTRKCALSGRLSC